MNEYSNDIQIGFRWADAPAFRFENLSFSRASIAAHEVTATFDIVVADKPLTREIPAQPMLTFLFNLSLRLNALARKAARVVELQLVGTASTLRFSRAGKDVQFAVVSGGRTRTTATLRLDDFCLLFGRRIRELNPTLDRLPHSDTKRIFRERVQICELLLKGDGAPGSIPALVDANLCFSTKSMTQDGDRLETSMAVDPWEVRHRPPSQWFGEFSIAGESRRGAIVAGSVLAQLRNFLEVTEPSVKLARPERRAVGRNIGAEQGPDSHGAVWQMFRSTDERRILLGHVGTLARDMAHRPGGPSATGLLKLARAAQEQAVALLSNVDITFDDRKRELAQIVSEPAFLNDSGTIAPTSPRPFAARNLRRLRLDREWAINVEEAGPVEHVAADPTRLLLAFRRSLVQVDLREATAATVLRSAPGSTLRYDIGGLGVRLRSGASVWSFDPDIARLVSWPEELTRSTVTWWRHMSDGTLVAFDEQAGQIYRKRRRFRLENFAEGGGHPPLAVDSKSSVQRSKDGRIRLFSLQDGAVEWTAPATLGDASIVSLQHAFVVVVVPGSNGQKVIWLDRQSGFVTWSSELPTGRSRIHATQLGPVVTTVSAEHGLLAIRLDARTGSPGLFGRFDVPEDVLDIRIEGEHLFVRTSDSVICTALTGRLHEPKWTLTHQQRIPSDQVRWAISDDIIAILGDHLTLVAVETGRVVFEVTAFWEELVFVSIDEGLHLVVVERRGGGELTVHRLHCRGFLAPVE